MARWNIRRALEAAALLAARWPREWARLSGHLGLSQAESAWWRNTADTIVDGLDPKTGLFEQFAGYFALEDIDLAPYAGRSVPMDVVLGRERTRQSQVVKQADMVALIALAPQAFPPGAAAANFGYYEPLCGHGSSLSPAMHDVVAARPGQPETALRYFHLTAVFGFAGLSLLTDGIALDPRPPASWTSLRFPCQRRGRGLEVWIDPTPNVVAVSMAAGSPMKVTLAGTVYVLERDRRLLIGTSHHGGAACSGCSFACGLGRARPTSPALRTARAAPVRAVVQARMDVISLAQSRRSEAAAEMMG